MARIHGGNLVGVSKSIAKMTGNPTNLGGVDLSATTSADVFQGSASGNKFSVTAVNRNATSIKLRLGFSSTTATFENANYVEYDVIIPANGVLERTDLVIQDNTQYFVAESDTANVNVTAYGFTF